MVPVGLAHSSDEGYCLVLKRDVGPGDIILAADAYMIMPRSSSSSVDNAARDITDDPAWTSIFEEVAEATKHVTFDDILDALDSAHNNNSAATASSSPFSCEHKDLLQLAIAVLIREQREADASAESKNGQGFRTPVSFGDVRCLVSHKEVLMRKDRGRHWAALQRTAKLLRRCAAKCPSLHKLVRDWSAPSGVPDPDPATLLLQLKFNVFPIKDFATASANVGIGCFPFASYFNHTCDRYACLGKLCVLQCTIDGVALCAGHASFTISSMAGVQ